MTGRISLVEQYENKDVIVQVKKCLDQSAEAVTVSQASAATATEAATNANAASARANAASEQAETASATVATYGTRLDAVEDQSAANRSSIQTIDGEITDIYNDLTNVVRKVGEAGQVVMNGLDLRGTNRTSDTVVGELNNLIVNAKRLINEIDAKLNAYTQMMRTTGDQNYTGIKTAFDSVRKSKNTSSNFALVNKTPTEGTRAPLVSLVDVNDSPVYDDYIFHGTDNARTRDLVLYHDRVNGDTIIAFWRLSITETFVNVSLIVLKNGTEAARTEIGRLSV